MGLEQDAQTGGVEGARHVDRTFQLGRMVGVVGVHAHAVRLGDLFEAPVGKGGDGVGKGGADLFAGEASRKGHGDGCERVCDIVATQHGDVRPVSGILLRLRRKSKRHDLGNAAPRRFRGTDPINEFKCLRMVGTDDDGVGCLPYGCTITVKIIFF